MNAVRPSRAAVAPIDRPAKYVTRRDDDKKGVRSRGTLHLFAVHRVTIDGKVAEVESEIPHNCLHSPDGMDQGHGGLGAEDLARTIVGHWLGTDAPHRATYSRFKSMFVSPAPMYKPLTLWADQIEKFMATYDTQGVR